MIELHRLYERRLDEFGATHQGADWAAAHDAREAARSFDAHQRSLMAIVDPVVPGLRLLDFGCGWGALYERIASPGIYDYTGIDISAKAIRTAKARFPDAAARFHTLDINEHPVGTYDYVVANGVFTRRTGVAQSDFWEFMTGTLEKLWAAARRGIAWNVLSSHVDYETGDWFHVPFDGMARFVQGRLGCRQFSFRQDNWPIYTVHARRP